MGPGSEGHGTGLRLVSVEEEGLFLLGGHRTWKLHLINAKKVGGGSAMR